VFLVNCDRRLLGLSGRFLENHELVLLLTAALIPYEVFLSERLPGAARGQSVDGLAVASAEGVVVTDVLCTHSENDEATRAQCVEHVFKAPRGHTVNSQAPCTRHHVEITAERFGQCLLAYDKHLNVFVEALFEQSLFLGVATLLPVDLSEAALDEKLAKLAATGAKVENFGILSDRVFGEDLGYTLRAHHRLSELALIQAHCDVSEAAHRHMRGSQAAVIRVNGAEVASLARRRRTEASLGHPSGQLPHFQLQLVEPFDFRCS